MNEIAYLRETKRLLSIPLWEELLELEIIRREGKTNMFDRRAILDELEKRNLKLAVNYINLLESENIKLTNVIQRAISYYERVKGSRESWIK